MLTNVSKERDLPDHRIVNTDITEPKIFDLMGYAISKLPNFGEHITIMKEEEIAKFVTGQMEVWEDRQRIVDFINKVMAARID